MELEELIIRVQQLSQEAGLAYNLGETEKAARYLSELRTEIDEGLKIKPPIDEQEQVASEEPDEDELNKVAGEQDAAGPEVEQPETQAEKRAQRAIDEA